MATTPYLKSVKPVSEHDASKVATYNELADESHTAIAGYISISVAGTGDVTLTRAQAMNKVFKFTGALTGARTILFPVSLGCSGQFTVWNATTGAFSLTIKTTAGGSSGVGVTQGTKSLCAHDGTDVFSVVAGGGSGDAFTSNPLSQFAATTSAQLAGVISDELGSGLLVFATPVVEDITGTTYTLTAADNGKLKRTTNTSAVTITFPSGLGQGWNCGISQDAAGQITFATSGGATTKNRQGHTKTAGDGATVSLIAFVANVATISGDTAA